MKASYKVALWLENHTQIAQVLHPALHSHPQHEIACKQSYGHSGVFAFKLVDPENSDIFLNNLKVFLKVESFGGFESFMKRFECSGVEDTDEDLINVSIGLEDVEDLIADIQQALNF